MYPALKTHTTHQYTYMYIIYICTCNVHVQWNLSNPDTIGPEESVLIKEVSLFQRLKCTQALNLGREYVPCLERCP